MKTNLNIQKKSYIKKVFENKIWHDKLGLGI